MCSWWPSCCRDNSYSNFEGLPRRRNFNSIQVIICLRVHNSHDNVYGEFRHFCYSIVNICVSCVKNTFTLSDTRGACKEHDGFGTSDEYRVFFLQFIVCVNGLKCMLFTRIACVYNL